MKPRYKIDAKILSTKEVWYGLYQRRLWWWVLVGYWPEKEKCYTLYHKLTDPPKTLPDVPEYLP